MSSLKERKYYERNDGMASFVGSKDPALKWLTGRSTAQTYSNVAQIYSNDSERGGGIKNHQRQKAS
jgi:hypothetical protein